MRCFLGLDTSCYTTSAAILDETGRLLADERRPLAVKAGARGLKQSEMVFQHTRHLPALIRSALAKLPAGGTLGGIGASFSPRSAPDSYMPAFLVGAGYAEALAAAQRAPLTRLSHQEGHILAGVWSAGGPQTSRYLAIHLSGGTTEAVLAETQPSFRVTPLGGGLDLSAGQFIDRVGVAMGLPFPAGRHLEALAAQAEPAAVPVAARGLGVSFAGPATHALRLLARGAAEPAAVAAGVQDCIGRSAAKLILAAAELSGAAHCLLVGGVTANRTVRRLVLEQCADRLALYFPDAPYSSDNAAGAAYGAYRAWLQPPQGAD